MGAAILFPAVLWPAVYFEPNRGQAPVATPFLARTGQGIVGVQATELSFAGGGRIRFEGANSSARLEGGKTLPGVSHYALDRDPSRWIYDVPHYASVLARGVYAGIDARYHENRGHVEFDFEIAPGADLSEVRLRFDGDIRISGAGDLSAAGVGLHKPLAWQISDGRRRAVEVEFRTIGRRTAGLRIGAHDPRLPLIVDPVIDFATFLGGSSNEFDTQMTVDSSGAIYMAGSTQSTDFPAMLEAGSPLNSVGLLFNPDVYVTRLKSDASAIDWSFFIGGSASNRCMGISQDSLGNIYVLGTTTSADFPVTAGAWKTTINSGFNDEFALKLDAATGHIVAGTFLDITPRNGGAVSGPFAVDSAGGVYVSAYSVDSTFQPTAGAYRTTVPVGSATGSPALLHLNANLTSIVYATYIDLGTISSLQVDSGGNAVFAGVSPFNSSTPFPAVNPISHVSQTGGGLFVAKINAGGTALVHASLLDGNAAAGSSIGDLMLDTSGNIYIAGETTDPQFPQVNPLTLDPLPTGYPKPGNVWPSPFIAELPPQGGKYTQSTFMYGPEFTTPGGQLASAWIKFGVVGGRVCVAGLGIVGSLTQTVGGLGGAPLSQETQVGGSTLVCADPASTYLDTRTYLPYTGGSYSAAAPTPDGALLFAGVTSGSFTATAGVVQPSFGGVNGDAFLYRVSLPNPVPQISFVYPDSLLITNQTSGTNTFDLAGSGFGAGMQVTVNGQLATVTVYSSTQASFSFNYGSLNAGSNQVVASLGGPGGGASAPAIITGVNQAPGTIGLSPSSVAAGAGETKVVVTGTNLSPSSIVTWGGVARAATFVGNATGSGYLQLVLEPAELAQAATISVTVTNPGPGGGAASTLFIVQSATGEPVPAVWGPIATPSEYPTAIATSSASTLVFYGGPFDSTTQIYWDGSAIPAKLNSSNTITLTPPAGGLSRPGAHSIYAANGSLVSNTLRLYIDQPIPTTAIGQAYDPVLQRLYLVSETSRTATSQASLIVYDTAAGAQIANVPNVLVNAGPITVSDDGQFVYIAGGTDGLQVVRFNVAAGAVDLSWQVALPPLSVTGAIQNIFVASHSPKTLIVTLLYTPAFETSRNGANVSEGVQTIIYDGAVPRFLTGADSGIQLAIVTGGILYLPQAVFATQNRVVFRNGFPDGVTTCWEWLDFDSFGIEGGNSVCGVEPAELVHDHGVSYLTDGNRTLALTFLNVDAGNLGSPTEFLVDPVHRSAWSLLDAQVIGQLTTFSLDTLQQTVAMLPSAFSTGTLYLTPTGPLLVTANSFLPIP